MKVSNSAPYIMTSHLKQKCQGRILPIPALVSLRKGMEKQKKENRKKKQGKLLEDKQEYYVEVFVFC